MRLQLEGNIKHINVIITTYDLAAKKVDSKFLRHLKPTVSSLPLMPLKEELTRTIVRYACTMKATL